jgi:Kef-type K+ transport system membrane component KefB
MPMEIDTVTILIFAFPYLALIAALAKSKNRRIWPWLLLSIVLPVLGLIVLIFAWPVTEDRDDEDAIS